MTHSVNRKKIPQTTEAVSVRDLPLSPIGSFHLFIFLPVDPVSMTRQQLFYIHLHLDMKDTYIY